MSLQQRFDAVHAIAQLRNSVEKHQSGHSEAQQQHAGVLLEDI